MLCGTRLFIRQTLFSVIVVAGLASSGVALAVSPQAANALAYLGYPLKPGQN